MMIRSGSSRCSRSATSIPSMPGIRTSRITMSGSTRGMSSSADSPSVDSPTSSKPGVESTIARAAIRNNGWSSTVTTRTGRRLALSTCTSSEGAAAIHKRSPRSPRAGKGADFPA